jgi:hypothetical protein
MTWILRLAVVAFVQYALGERDERVRMALKTDAELTMKAEVLAAEVTKLEPPRRAPSPMAAESPQKSRSDSKEMQVQAHNSEVIGEALSQTERLNETQWEPAHQRKLPPYDHPSNAFETAYGQPQDTYWDPLKGHFDYQHRSARYADAFHAMFHLIKNTYFGKSYEEVDIYRRCRGAKRDYRYLLHGRIDACKGDHGSNYATPCRYNLQKKCVWTTLSFLDETLKVMENVFHHVYEVFETHSVRDAIIDNIRQLRQDLENLPGEPQDLYDFNTDPPTPLGVLQDLNGHLSSWSKDGKFFYDDMGARQGMWVMLHLMTIHSEMQNVDLQMGFYKKIVMHWNPCSTCRKRYWIDMKKIVIAGNPEVNAILDDNASSISVDPIVDMWIYHTEVSMRVQAGMKRDLGFIDANVTVDDWSPAIRSMARRYAPEWGKDKRWPSTAMCPDCWNRGACQDYVAEEDGGHQPIDRDKFLSCWNVENVKGYLKKTYGNWSSPES